MNRRYGKLFASTFVTYRKDTDDSPSKVWPITKNVILSAVEDHEYHLRHANTSTLWAVAAGAYTKKHMWGFTVTWTALVGGPDKLALAFDTKDDAEEWHQAFSEAISRAALNMPRSISAASDASTANLDIPETPLPSRQADVAQQDQQGGAEAEPVVAAPSRKIRAWASVLHINGISVYMEEQDENGEGGAVMVSAVVRAPPVDVFRVSISTSGALLICFFSSVFLIK